MRTEYREGAKAPGMPFFASVHLGGLLLLLLVAGCRGTLSPLSNKLEIGQESYFVFVADGEEGRGDLFAAAPSGGQPYQITFTRIDERSPSLGPNGEVIAFIRRLQNDSTLVVIMNLLNGGERVVGDGEAVTGLAWNSSGTRLYLRTASGFRVVDAPPATSGVAKVEAAEFPAADSAFKVLLGDPPVGEAGECAQGGVCALLPTGSTVLAADGRAPAHWAGDSIVYSVGNDLIVRPLAGGATRVIQFTGKLMNPRQVSLFEFRK